MQYVAKLMEWIEKQINNEDIFPVQVGTYTLADVIIISLSSITHTHTHTGVPFPKAFTPCCKKILTRLYRVFVHVYIHHFDKIQAIGAVS